MKEEENNKYKDLSKEEKKKKKYMEEIGTRIWKKKLLKKQNIDFLYKIRMSVKTLKFGNVIVNKKECHVFKQAIALNLVDTDKIVISDRFNTVIMILNILLGTKNIISSDLYISYCLK